MIIIIVMVFSCLANLANNQFTISCKAMRSVIIMASRMVKFMGFGEFGFVFCGFVMFGIWRLLIFACLGHCPDDCSIHISISITTYRSITPT